jgi:hypothetical protein
MKQRRAGWGTRQFKTKCKTKRRGKIIPKSVRSGCALRGIILGFRRVRLPLMDLLEG